MIRQKIGIIFMISCLIIGCATSPKTTVEQIQATTIKETKKVVSKYTSPKHRVAVIDFENKTTYGTKRLGTSVSDILTTELVKSEKFIMIERAKLDKILDEQKLQKEIIIDQHTAVNTGKLLGLSAIITGCVSQFGVKTEGADYLVSQHKRQIAEATVDIRVIDVETGQILYADSGKGKAEKKTGQILGLGTKSGYDETLESEALRAAIVKFINNIIYQINQKPWSCKVAEVVKEEIYLDAGQMSGLNLGTQLEVYHLGKEITSPSTGLIIGRVEEKKGVITVFRYFGEDGAVAKLTEGAFPIKGDLCRLK